MSLLLVLVCAFVIGVASSFIGAMAGGSAIISVPALIFLGLTPYIAIATNKFGSICLCIGALVTFWKKKQIPWKFAIPFSLIAVVGGLIESHLLLEFDLETFKFIALEYMYSFKA